MASIRRSPTPTSHARRLSRSLAVVPSLNDILDATLAHGGMALLAAYLPLVSIFVGASQVRLATTKWALRQSRGMRPEVWAVLAIELCAFAF